MGALGDYPFPAGWYVYTGSARNGVHQRIRRHLRREKRKHWHIDYLLAVADSVEAFVMLGTSISECELHASLKGMMAEGLAILIVSRRRYRIASSSVSNSGHG